MNKSITTGEVRENSCYTYFDYSCSGVVRKFFDELTAKYAKYTKEEKE